jgi:hypothetical protein
MSIHARGADQHADGRLDAVLRAAAAPAHPAELAGEQQAVAAFRAAATAAPRRSILARILTVKVLVIGSVAASTGVVLAVSGVLPPTSPERPAGPPAELPAVVTTSPLPAGTPPAGDPPAEDPPAETERSGQVAPPAVTTEPSEDPSRQSRDRQDRDRKDRGDEDDDTPMTTGPAGPRGRAQTPDSSAPGAETAVPPTGATPPPKGS